MKKNPHALHLAHAAAGAAGAGASPEHKRFRTLLARLEAARERLAAWHEQLPLFTRAHAERVRPEIERLAQARRAWALELGEIALARWSKDDRETLTQMLLDLCGALLDAADPDDPADPADPHPLAEIEALYNRFADVDYAEEQRQHLQAMKEAMAEMGGLDLGDDPVASMEDLMRRVQAHTGRERSGERGDERAGERGSEADAAARGHAEGPAAASARPRRRKTAAERRAEEEAQRVTQTVREVYRKLAAALHPDRTAADAPAAERDRRLALMQEANRAYEAGDLLALLALQLRIEQVDAAHAAGVAAAQVKHFNKVLAEQLREVEAEIQERRMALCATYGVEPRQPLKPDQLVKLITEELRQLAAAHVELAREQRVLRGEPAGARRFLKQVRAEMRLHEQMDDLMSGQFDELFARAGRSPVHEPRPAKRRKR